MLLFLQCARIGSKVHTFNASDADHGRNAELTYAISLTDGNNVSSPLFVIDNVTGVLTTSAKLTDKGGSNYKVSGNLLINLIQNAT